MRLKNLAVPVILTEMILFTDKSTLVLFSFFTIAELRLQKGPQVAIPLSYRQLLKIDALSGEVHRTSNIYSHRTRLTPSLLQAQDL